MSRPRKGPRLYLRTGRGRAAKYVILDGAREISTGCGQDRAAQAEAAFADYLAGKYIPPPSAGKSLDQILIADVLTAYLTEHAPHTASAEFIGHTSAPVLEWWGDKTLANVRGASCRAYVAWRTAQRVLNAKRNVSAATARHELKTMRAAINHWHREHGPLPSVPAVTLPEGAPPRESWITRDEAARAIRAARRTRQVGHIARVILIGVYTGTRPGALLGLGWLPSPTNGWFDLDAGLLYRRGTGARRTKKRQTPAKIPDRLLPHLKRWRRLDMELSRKPMLQVIHYGGKPVTKLRNSWRKVMSIAKIGNEVTPHILRHTAATWLMQGGADLYEAAGFLGMSPQMLDEVYGHHHPDFQAGAANAQRSRRRTAREQKSDAPKECPKNHRQTAAQNGNQRNTTS